MKTKWMILILLTAANINNMAHAASDENSKFAQECTRVLDYSTSPSDKEVLGIDEHCQPIQTQSQYSQFMSVLRQRSAPLTLRKLDDALASALTEYPSAEAKQAAQRCLTFLVASSSEAEIQALDFPKTCDRLESLEQDQAFESALIRMGGVHYIERESIDAALAIAINGAQTK